MKKLFLFTCLSALALSFNSCSKDDDSSSSNNNGGISGTVSFKIDGVQKIFNTVTINEEIYNEDDNGNIDSYYEVTASDNGSSTEFIYFEINKGETGASSIYPFGYTSNNKSYNGYSNFSSNTTDNSTSKLKGTFSGTVSTFNDGSGSQSKQITEGKFDINL